MKEVFSEIDIQAPAERVWQVLTDFARYPEWNPFIRRINGEPKEGARLRVYIEPPGAKGRTYRPKVLKAEPKHELRWLGRPLIPGLFDCDHIFTIGHIGSERVRFVQREIVSGVLVASYAHDLEMKMRLGFEQMNQALKTRAEQVCAFNP